MKDDSFGIAIEAGRYGDAGGGFTGYVNWEGTDGLVRNARFTVRKNL